MSAKFSVNKLNENMSELSPRQSEILYRSIYNKENISL
jgi:hypothetical protein